MENGELLSERREEAGRGDHRRDERGEHIEYATRRAQAGEEQHHDGRRAGERIAQGFLEVRAVQGVRFALQVYEHGVGQAGELAGEARGLAHAA